MSLYILAGVGFLLLSKIYSFQTLPSAYHFRSSSSVCYDEFFGDSIIFDGLIIGAAYLVSIPVGVATTIAVVMHEIPQEIEISGCFCMADFPREGDFLNFIVSLFAFAELSEQLFSVLYGRINGGYYSFRRRFFYIYCRRGFDSRIA